MYNNKERNKHLSARKGFALGINDIMYEAGVPVYGLSHEDLDDQSLQQIRNDTQHGGSFRTHCCDLVHTHQRTLRESSSEKKKHKYRGDEGRTSLRVVVIVQSPNLAKNSMLVKSARSCRRDATRIE